MAKNAEEKKVKKVAKKDSKNKNKAKKGPKESYFKKVKKEVKLVKWPSAKEIFKYTISTIVLCLILCAVFMLLNFGLAIVKGWF